MIGFHVTELTPGERALQAEVREFLAEELPRGSFEPGLGMNGAKDPSFSKKLGARGWLGMALPTRYGGHDRSAVDRFVVAEELLRWGAPIGHHWVADRQSGPMIARYGTEEQKQRFLPAIAAGELSFSIGMSEPDSGSDLASLTTKAVRDGDGWIVTGRKIWTTFAHVNDWMIVLCRTTPVEASGDKRVGLTQLLVDLHAPGLTITPIRFIDGTSDFAEVVLDEVFVPDDLVLGDVGAGWMQNTSELAFERGGPDRWLSTYLLVEEIVRRYENEEAPDDVVEMVGRTGAMYWVLQQLSLSIARATDEGRSPSIEAALVKEMGTRFEQNVVDAVLRCLDRPPVAPGRTSFERLLVTATLTAPSFTVRGGTSEILRSVAAKGMQPSTGRRSADDVLKDTVDRLLAASCTFELIEQAEVDGWCAPVWDPLAAAGFPWVSVSEAAGGSGGSLTDAMAVLRAVGRHAAPVPVAETMLAAWLAAAAGIAVPDGPMSVLCEPIDAARGAAAPWGRHAERIIGLRRERDGWQIVVAEPEQFDVVPGCSIAGEPRDEIRITAPLDELIVVPAPEGIDRMALQRRGALTRVVMAAGALEALTQLTVDYTHERRQFGKPVASFQAVQAHLVQAAQATARVSMAADVAVRALETGDGRVEIAAAKVLLDDAVTEATRAAHQAHGALGVTREYRLHHLTRRLWSWRDEYGTARWWRDWLGLELVAGGADDLFPTLTR